MKTATPDITVARITAAAVILAAIIGTAGALGAGWFQNRDPKPTTSVPSDTTTTLATKLVRGLTIGYPPPEGTELVESCHITAWGSGTVPTGKALVVAAKADRDPRLWFEGTVNWNPERTRWSADIGLKGRPGAVFTVYAVILDAELAKYLVSTNRGPGETWWSSVEMPPDARAADQANIRRSPLAPDC
jgi:hypothetical protein